MPFKTREAARANYAKRRNEEPQWVEKIRAYNKEYSAKWREKNLEAARKYQREWAAKRRAKLRGDKPLYYKAPWKTKEEKLLVKRAGRKRHYYRHQEKLKKERRQDRADNPEKYRSADAKRWREHKDKRTLNNFIQRAKRHGVRLYCTPGEWLALLKQFDFRCFYCHIELTKKTRTFDHKLPLSRGGTNEIENLVPCCRRCNYRKGTKTVEEFLIIINK
jgi:5-methylcytosine-specific restriction endonuclease McrA